MLFKKRGDADKKARKTKEPIPAKSQDTSAVFWEPNAAPAKTASDTKQDVAPEAAQTSAGNAVIRITDIAELVVATGGLPATGEVSHGWLALGPKDGGWSIDAIDAREGDVFVATAVTILISPGENGTPSRYRFGPMFFDADDKVLTWWTPFDKPVEKASEISVTATAPAGTAKVRLGVRGTFDAKGETGDYRVGFSSPQLSRVAE